MLEFYRDILPAAVFAMLEELMPTTTVNSFDCARLSMGVVQVTIDPWVLIPATARGGRVEERVARLEQQLARVGATIDNLLGVNYIGVWRLGKNADAISDAWDIAPPLRTRLEKMDQKFGAPDRLLYEFQMGANDKSRTVSTMLAYHYSGRGTVRIPPAVKNTLCPVRALTRDEFARRCPQISARRKKAAVFDKSDKSDKSDKKEKGKMTTILALLYPGGTERRDLSIQTFLAIVTESYDANKLHTAACLEWWASYFGIDLQWVPADCLDDAGDAFMQLQGALRKRMI